MIVYSYYLTIVMSTFDRERSVRQRKVVAILSRGGVLVRLTDCWCKDDNYYQTISVKGS